jgi:exopolysaccharide biosynthesis WecB/TagA/CpsF family protein
MKERLKILNIEVDDITRDELLQQFSSGVLVTPNVDHLMKLQKDKEFYNIYQKADWITVDSQVVRLAMKFLGRSVKETVTGSDFFPAFYNYHRNNESVKIFLLGADRGVAHKAMNKINKKIGREIVVGCHSPSFGFEKDELECNTIIKIINSSEANVLVVGVGAPKQEKWIFKYKSQLNKIRIYMAIGATIDFEAGNIKRAPKFIQKIALEWLYRLISEPRRLWKRYIVDDFPFILLIFKQKMGKYKNPFN